MPKAFVKYFKDAGLEIGDFIIILTAAQHRLKPDGLHTGEGRGGDWNTEWQEYIDKNPKPDAGKIVKKLNRMKKKYGIK